jgi:hypothetical protein
VWEGPQPELPEATSYDSDGPLPAGWMCRKLSQGRGMQYMNEGLGRVQFKRPQDEDGHWVSPEEMQGDWKEVEVTSIEKDDIDGIAKPTRADVEHVDDSTTVLRKPADLEAVLRNGPPPGDLGRPPMAGDIIWGGASGGSGQVEEEGKAGTSAAGAAGAAKSRGLGPGSKDATDASTSQAGGGVVRDENGASNKDKDKGNVSLLRGSVVDADVERVASSPSRKTVAGGKGARGEDSANSQTVPGTTVPEKVEVKEGRVDKEGGGRREGGARVEGAGGSPPGVNWGDDVGTGGEGGGLEGMPPGMSDREMR